MLSSFLLEDAGVEKVTYSVWQGKSRIGELVAEKREENNLTTYSTQTTTSFSLMGKHTILHNVEATFKNGMLVSSKMSSVKDGKPKNNTTINWKGGHYEIVENGKMKKHEGSVKMTSVMLYFVQPSLSAKVMSERDASFKTVEPGSEGKLTVTSGRKSDSQDYLYQNGLLKEVVVHNTLFTINIRRE